MPAVSFIKKKSFNISHRFSRWWGFVSLFLPLGLRPSNLYTLLGSDSCFTTDHLYLNLGLWNKNTKTLDQASVNLAHRMAVLADLNNSHHLLDVGFGFAEQDLYWHKTFNVKKITGINICEAQVDIARKKVNNAGLSNCIDLAFGNALHLSFGDDSFDRIFAMECAMHFNPRERFLKEAFRVLKPGGKLILMDICGLSTPLSISQRLIYKLACMFWQLPTHNLYPLKDYETTLKNHGFIINNIRSIKDQVYYPCFDYLHSFLKDSQQSKNKHPFFKWGARIGIAFAKRFQASPFDYVEICVSKPKD